MRRPVKYKTRQAQKQRLITIVAASVLGVGVIGGAAAAVALNRDDEPDSGVGTDSGYVDTIDTAADSDSQIPESTDTTAPDGTDTDTASPDTDAVTETATPDTETAAQDTEPTPDITEDITPGGDVNPGGNDAQGGTQQGGTLQGGTQSSAIDVGTTKNYKGGYLDLSEYPTTAELESAALVLKAQGYTAVMVELKYDNGKLSYKSSVAKAKEYGANPSVAALSLDDIVDTLHGAGLYVTGRVCALRDDLAAKGDTDAALMNTAGFRYSDGASRWISVYSDTGTDYILSLLAEMKNAGVDEIMLRDYALPADAGTTSPAYDKTVSKTDAVKTFVSSVKDTLSGTALNLEMDAVTIAAGNDTTQGIDCSALAALCDSVTADITLSNLSDGMTIGGVTIADVDADPAKTVETVLKALDASALNIRPLFELTGNASTDAAQIAAAENRGYAAYQMTARVVSMNEK